MKISYYTHAWQSLLMLLAGTVSVGAAFAGYLHGGGGEELLRSSLRSLKTGRANFESCVFDLRAAELKVKKVRHEDLTWLDTTGKPVATVSGLHADELSVKLELFPWPPREASFRVNGAKDIQISLTENVLHGYAFTPGDNSLIPPVRFEHCDISLSIGKMRPVKLSECNGYVGRTVDGNLRGSFSLQTLNGKPFGLRLDIREDGQWALSGANIRLDTRETLKSATGLFADSVNPLGLLVKALFSGETAAEGDLIGLKIAFSPATVVQPFLCEGDVDYANLNLRLPTAGQPSADVLPSFLSQLLGGDERGGESLWPRWMRVDSVKTGPLGHLHFRMSGPQIEFSFSDGADGALTGVRQGRELPPLEALGGTVETVSGSKPKRIALHGYVGDYAFESRVERAVDNSRSYDLQIMPRGGSSKSLDLNAPLWRFSSKISDYFSAQTRPQLDGGNVMAGFQVEMDVMDFPADDWLPAGMGNVTGTLRATGRITDKFLLRFDSAEIITTASVASPKEGDRVTGNDFYALWEGFRTMTAGAKPWQLVKLDARGPADVIFSPDLRWSSITLDKWVISECVIARDGRVTDWRDDKLNFNARLTRLTEDTMLAKLAAEAVSPDWGATFNADWRLRGEKPSGRFILTEKNIPAAKHPTGQPSQPGPTVVRLNDGIVSRGSE